MPPKRPRFDREYIDLGPAQKEPHAKPLNKKETPKFALQNISLSLQDLNYTLEKKNTKDMKGVKIDNIEFKPL